MILDMPKPFPNESATFSWLIVIVFSIWGGAVRYLMDNPLSQIKISWKSCASQLIISCFVGFLGGLYCYEIGWSNNMVLLAAGVSGNLGSNLLYALWQRILKIAESKKNTDT